MKAIANNEVAIIVPEIDVDTFNRVMNSALEVVQDQPGNTSVHVCSDGREQKIPTAKMQVALVSELLSRVQKNDGVALAALGTIAANMIRVQSEYVNRGYSERATAKNAGKHDGLLSLGTQYAQLKLAVALEPAKPRAAKPRKAS